MSRGNLSFPNHRFPRRRSCGGKGIDARLMTSMAMAEVPGLASIRSRCGDGWRFLARAGSLGRLFPPHLPTTEGAPSRADSQGRWLLAPHPGFGSGELAGKRSRRRFATDVGGRWAGWLRRQVHEVGRGDAVAVQYQPGPLVGQLRAAVLGLL